MPRGPINPALLPECPSCHAPAGKQCWRATGESSKLTHSPRLRAFGIPLGLTSSEQDKYVMDRAAEKGVSPFVAHRRGKTAGQPQHQPQRRHEALATPPVPPAEPPKAAGPTRHTRPGTMLLYTTLQGAEVCITIEGACTIEFT